MVNQEVLDQMYKEQENIRLAKNAIARIKREYKEDIKDWNKHMRKRKASLARLEKKCYAK